MSSSFRNRAARPRGFAALAGLCGLACAAAHAQQVYWQPQVSVTGTYNTNLELTPVAAEKVSGAGYIADAASLIGIATPTSQTTLRPDIRYEYYPTDSSLNRLEAFLDLNSQMSWERDRFAVFGRADRLSDLSVETPGPVYNPVNPELPQTPSTGRVIANEVRNEVYVVPTYSHSVTPLGSLGLSGTFQHMSFSPADEFDHVDYNYYQGRPYYDYQLNARTLLTLGAFASRYSASNIDSHSHDYGTDAEVRYNWTPVFRTTVEVLYQRTTLDQVTPLPFKATTSNWGANVNAQYTGQVNRLKASIGREILPSSAGSLYNTDRLQAQYDHDFTQRLTFTGAVLYQKIGTLASSQVGNTRSYTSNGVFLQWMMTPLLFVRGGYSYIWQKYQTQSSGGANNQILLQFGYIDRGRQR